MREKFKKIGKWERKSCRKYIKWLIFIDFLKCQRAVEREYENVRWRRKWNVNLSQEIITKITEFQNRSKKNSSLGQLIILTRDKWINRWIPKQRLKAFSLSLSHAQKRLKIHAEHETGFDILFKNPFNFLKVGKILKRNIHSKIDTQRILEGIFWL